MNHIYKYLLSAIILLTTIGSGNAQKHYVWCPDDVEVKPRAGMADGAEVGLVVYDGRVISKKGKIECSSDEVTSAIAHLLEKVYPSVRFAILNDSAYYKKGTHDRPTLKIGLSAYHAGFGVDVSTGVGIVGGSFAAMAFPKGEWNAATALYVQFEDGESSTEKEISNVASRPNVLGYKSARKGLQESYEKSVQQLLFFLDKELAKIQ
ncbi:hypothetical protein [Parapedobacter soli]|uniref:hypothetical protein n=1 Tax=Parapedobacter soli TaxID=416955 RepID=UPI0021C9109A|nr:hypothetical protein [Parapedobacter soli]